MMRFRHKTVERSKSVIFIVLLMLTSAITGSAIPITGLKSMFRSHAHMNTSLFLQAVPVQAARATPATAGTDQTSAILAVDDVKLDQMARENQESKDDRRLLHDQIAKIAETENLHFNAFTDRMNINDARISTIGWALGILFTLSQALVLFFHLDSRFKRGRRKTDV